MFRPFKDSERYFNGEISLDEFIDSCISEIEAGIRYIVENEYDVIRDKEIINREEI